MRGDFKILLVLAFIIVPLNTLARSQGQYVESVADKTMYIDQFFEVEKDGQVTAHVYLGDDKLMSIANEDVFYLSDHLGSITYSVDKYGEIIEQIDYLPFGKIISGSSQYGFNGNELDVENSLNYFSQRYYDPSLAKFLSVDPALYRYPEKFLENVQELNSYAYVRNNPIKYIDPLGLETKVYIEKSDSRLEDYLMGHSFVAVDSLVYNWDDNVGSRYNLGQSRWGSEDLEINTWEEFSSRDGFDDNDYHIYSFDTDKSQERDIRRFYLDLSSENSNADSDQRRHYSWFFNGVDAVIGSMRSGGILSEDFNAGRLVSRAKKLKSAFDARMSIDRQNNVSKKNFYFNRFRNRVKQGINEYFFWKN